MQAKIFSDIEIEELVASFPEAVGFLNKHGVRCVMCGEPVWGTLGKLLEEEGIEDAQDLIDELNKYIQRKRQNKAD